MAKEIEEYFVKRLQSYLLEYLQDFSQNNMAKFSLGFSTNIVLKNLQIKKQALLNFSFPMYIIDGKISSITINMPLTYKTSQPSMVIDDIDLQVCTIQEANIFVSGKDQQQHQGIENLKKHKLKIWEEQMAKYFEQLSPPNWIQKIVDGIYNNMSVHIKQFNLRFYNNSILGMHTYLKIKAGVDIKATDSKFQQKFNSDLNSIFKQIEIKELIVSLGKNGKKKDEMSILNQIDILARLTMNKNQEQLEKPLQTVSVTIDSPVIFQLNKETKNYLVKLNEVLKNLEIVQDNFHFRPKCEVKNNYGEWWKYLINAVMQNQKNHKLDLGYSSRRLVLMKRYIELYKRKQTIILVPWLTSWTIQDETKFKKCEEQLSLKDLLKYREWAFCEIRMEAKRYYHSSKDGQNQHSVKPVLEIWTNTINNQNSFKDHKKRDDDIPIELEDDEKINLYEILERDKTQVLSSYLKGQNNDPNQIKTQIVVSIHSIFFVILENRLTNLFNYSPKNTKIFQFCQCKKCIALIKKPNIDKKKNSSLSQSNSISEVVKQTQKQNEEGSFHTAKEIDSFYEDIEDLNRDESQFSMESSQDLKNNNTQNKFQDQQKTFNKLVLVISMIGIRIPLQIFQNGRMRTQKDEVIYVGEIKALAPGMIPKIMEEKNEDNQKQSPLFHRKNNFKDPNNQKPPKQDQLTKNKLTEFINEIFEISVSKESQQYFSNSEQCFTRLCEFLVINEMSNVKCFLVDYESNKHAFQDFTNEQFKQYDKYFQEVEKEEKDENEESMLLHVIRHPKTEKKWNLLKNAAFIHQDNKSGQNEFTWQGCSNKHRFLQEVHNKLIDVIRRSLFAPFIEDFGDKFLSNCLIHLKDKLTYPSDAKTHNLTIQMYLEGVSSEYSIQPNSDKKKRINSQQNLEEQSNSQITVEFKNLIFLLSTKSLNSLLNFAQTFDKSSLDQGSLYVTQDHKLLECILKSKPLSQEHTKQPKIKFDIKVLNKLKIRIVSDQISNVMKTELKFQLKNLSYQQVKFDDLFTGIPEFRKTTLYQQHFKYFIAQKLVIEQFKIAHKYFSPDFNYRNDELRMDSEKEPTEKQPNNQKLLSKQHTSQGQQDTLFKKQSQTIDPRQALKSQLSQQSQQNQQKQQEKKVYDPKYHIKGIKQTILDTQIVILKLNATIDNHALLTDCKIYIQIPFFNLKINDSFVCFIEAMMIYQKNMQKEQSSGQYKHKISQDSLLKAELDTLLNDHKKQSSDCKHCILKYRKTIQLINVMFGVIQDLTKESFLLPSWFHILHQECQQITQQNKRVHIDKSQEQQVHIIKKQKSNGIKISFLSTQKASNHGQYKSKIIFPVLVITRDKGFFKDNIMIHCSSTRTKDQGIVIKSSYKLDQESEFGSVSQFEKLDKHSNSNKDLSFQKSQPSSKRDSNQTNQINQNQLPEKYNKESNYIMVQPAFLVQDQTQLWSKLDDKFIFYCRSNEKEMFKQDFNLKENEKEPLENPLYLLFYYNRPLRVGLFSNKEIDVGNDKNQKKKVYFSLEKIEAVFQNQYAACNILTTIKNIKKIKQILETVHAKVNFDLSEEDTQSQNKLMDSPIKYLDEIIISANISNIYLKSNESFFKLHTLKIALNIDLMNQMQFNIKQSTVHNRTSQSLTNHEMYKQRSILLEPSNLLGEEDYSIMKIIAIQFNFNQVSMIDVKLISVKKYNDMLQFQVEDIQISIINNSSRVRENLLTMPWRDKNLQSQFSKKSDKPVAIQIHLEFQNMNPKIQLTIQQGKIQLSQQRVQDLLIAMNSFYLINIEESVSLRQHLLKYIFLQELHVQLGTEPTINIFVKDKIEQTKELYFILELDIQELQIALQEQEKIFFLFQLHQIMMKKKLNQELELIITRIEFNPQKISEEQIMYPNLIEQNGVYEMIFKLENKIIHIENFKFYIISKYLNELDAFKSKIAQILQKNRDDLAERYQNDFDLQLQIKLQENLEQNIESFNYTIQIKNSQLIIPESSQGINQIQIKFHQANLSLTKQKIAHQIPDIPETKIETINQNKLLIDYEDKYQKTWDNKLERQDLYVNNFDAAFKTVEVEYVIRNDSDADQPITGPLLFAETVNVKLDMPSFEQYLGTSGWKYKDQCKIQPQNLSMKLDLGKLLKVQSFLSNNFAEKSTLFEFSSSKLQKINFDLQLKDTSTQLTRYDQVGQEKLEKIKNARLFESIRSQRQSKQFSTQQKQQSKQQ